MPKYELKALQSELDQGQLWPVYWIYGPEKWKAREAVAWIRQALNAAGVWGGGLSVFNEESVDGGETQAGKILDMALELSLGGGLRFIRVREAHSIKNAELLSELLGPPRKAAELQSVCIFLSKDLDARKKFSKILLEKAAVVPCDEVTDFQKGAWIQYLAKRQGVVLDSRQSLRFQSQDPWSLDLIQQELEKFKIAASNEDCLLKPKTTAGDADHFVEAFFNRDLKAALPHAYDLAKRPEEALPLLGLLGWNVRHLVLHLGEPETRNRPQKASPFFIDRLHRWSNGWSLAEVQALQKDLAQLDFRLKQTPLLPLGLWTELVMSYCS